MEYAPCKCHPPRPSNLPGAGPVFFPWSPMHLRIPLPSQNRQKKLEEPHEVGLGPSANIKLQESESRGIMSRDSSSVPPPCPTQPQPFPFLPAPLCRKGLPVPGRAPRIALNPKEHTEPPAALGSLTAETSFRRAAGSGLCVATTSFLLTSNL